jgi:hypothetical protein
LRGARVKVDRSSIWPSSGIKDLLPKLPLVIHPALDDLGSLERRSVAARRAWVAHRRDQKGRGRIATGRRRQVPSHRDPSRVARFDDVRRLTQHRIEFPTAEEPRGHPGAARSEGLAALHRIEDRVTGVLLRPDASESTRTVGERSPHRITSGRHLKPLCWRVVRQTAPAVIREFFGIARISIMRIGRGDDPELVRINPEPGAFPKTFEQGIPDEVRTRNAALAHQHSRTAPLFAVRLNGPAPFDGVAELVRRTHHPVHAVATFRVALNLTNLDQWFEAATQPRAFTLYFEGQVAPRHGEHATAAEVRVVWNR